MADQRRLPLDSNMAPVKVKTEIKAERTNPADDAETDKEEDTETVCHENFRQEVETALNDLSEGELENGEIDQNVNQELDNLEHLIENNMINIKPEPSLLSKENDLINRIKLENTSNQPSQPAQIIPIQLVQPNVLQPNQVQPEGMQANAPPVLVFKSDDSLEVKYKNKVSRVLLL